MQSGRPTWLTCQGLRPSRPAQERLTREGAPARRQGPPWSSAGARRFTGWNGRRLITVADLEAATRRNACVRVVPLDLLQAREFALLAALEDPSDRMIVATARAKGRPLITGDQRIGDSGLVSVLWD